MKKNAFKAKGFVRSSYLNSNKIIFFLIFVHLGDGWKVDTTLFPQKQSLVQYQWRFILVEKIYLQKFWVEISPDINFEHEQIVRFKDSQNV